jgi:hypothetical protein
MQCWEHVRSFRESARYRRAGVGAAEHGDLVPQHEKLDVFRGGGAAHQQDQSE